MREDSGSLIVNLEEVELGLDLEETVQDDDDV